MSEFDAFGELERRGWGDVRRAAAYADLFSRATDMTIPDLGAAVRIRSGMRVLDLCCGQGNVSEALVAGGCDVVGIDFSSAMIALAESRVPDATFIEADAQDLPFEDREFDAVVCNFGIPHVPDQPRALAQVRRVLRPGGRFAMTVWCGPEESPAFGTFYAAVQAHAHPGVVVPQGPPFHLFADRETADRLFADAGFEDVEHGKVPCHWDLKVPEDLAKIFEEATVRAAALLMGQPAANLSAIRAQTAADVRARFAHGNGWRVPVPAAIVHAGVPAG